MQEEMMKKDGEQSHGDGAGSQGSRKLAKNFMKEKAADPCFLE